MEAKKKRIINVVGALMEQGGKYLTCQRKADDTFGSYWEFPGGKVERGEDKRAALIREIREELAVDIIIDGLVGIFWDELPHVAIRFFLYRSTITSGVPVCVECQQVKMATLDELQGMALTPVDKKAVQYLQERAVGRVCSS